MVRSGARQSRGWLLAVVAALGLASCSDEEGGLLGNVYEPPFPQLGVSDTLAFDYFIDTLTFRIENSGTGALNWQASASAGYLGLDPIAGSLAPGTFTTVTATLDRSGLATGFHDATVVVHSDSGQTDTLQVTVKHFDEPKWLLDRTIVDAEFNRATNRVVAVTHDNPPLLLRLDPETRTAESVLLPNPAAACVAVRGDGAYAAVGQNGFITYVDLSAMSVVETYSTSADVYDVVLPDNGFVYAFPREDQWVSVHCIELSTGLETLHSGRQITERSVGRFHPSGFLYTLNYSNPSDFEKLDIQAGTATYLYDGPYHGDYPLGSDFVISEDGTRIVSAAGTVFHASTDAADLTYAGQLDGMAPGRWVEHSSAAGRMFGIRLTNNYPFYEPAIRVYDSGTFAFKGTVPLPPFLLPNGSGGGTLADSEGRFVFCNDAGTRLYTLMRAGAPAPGEHWAIWATDVSILP